jgi:hypothetical protein
VGFASILKISILSTRLKISMHATVDDRASSHLELIPVIHALSSLAMAGLSVFDWSSTSHHPSDPGVNAKNPVGRTFINLPTGFLFATHYLDIR